MEKSTGNGSWISTTNRKGFVFGCTLINSFLFGLLFYAFFIVQLSSFFGALRISRISPTKLDRIRLKR
jgi:hypothetical protein